MKRIFILVMAVALLVGAFTIRAESPLEKKAPKFPAGVCPPFYLKDEAGNTIDPVHNINADKPYSPKQTCGAKGCHDYKKITEGFHFQQGKGEMPTEDMKKRYLWVTSPGNYGGNWCSPAPLYRSLAQKKNTNPRMIDMTSFDFVTATCGNCHPGGGPLEYDRDGFRYDQRMKELAMTSGGDNGLDGDYFKAGWIDTGVLEADCLICHLPEYDLKARNKQLENLNFRWAATAASGLGNITGSIKTKEPLKVVYDKTKFDENSMISLHLVGEPRNDTCLHCHGKPGWKKRGDSFNARNDVHMRAGLKCVDCHAAGSKAVDKRIKGKEVHQFGKGDDPSGHVRNDLDNTMRTCNDCHSSGYLGAPIAKHDGLPPFHMEKIACQTCHIPYRYVKAAQVQVSDVFNPAPKISPPPKHIWTFYDREMNYWNHYGELTMFTRDDQPTNPYRPALIRYKGKIYPANIVHSAWPGLAEEGKQGLNQPFMKDVFMMWKTHNEDPTKYPDLSKIRDDNGDGVPEVNRPEEIDAIIDSVRAYLTDTNYDLSEKKVVWVSDDRVFYSGTQSEQLPKHGYEASPYASVYKLTHDIAPAKAALGTKGCNECHRSNSQFFNRMVLQVPFQKDDAKPLWISNYITLGISPFQVHLGSFREELLKPFLYAMLALIILFIVLIALKVLAVRNGILSAGKTATYPWILLLVSIVGGLVVAMNHDLLSYMVVERSTLDANHFWIGSLLLITGLVVGIQHYRKTGGIQRLLSQAVFIAIGFTVVCGAIMLMNLRWFEIVTKLSHAGFDLGLSAIAVISAALLILQLKENPLQGQQNENPAER